MDSKALNQSSNIQQRIQAAQKDLRLLSRDYSPYLDYDSIPSDPSKVDLLNLYGVNRDIKALDEFCHHYAAYKNVRCLTNIHALKLKGKSLTEYGIDILKDFYNTLHKHGFKINTIDIGHTQYESLEDLKELLTSIPSLEQVLRLNTVKLSQKGGYYLINTCQQMELYTYLTKKVKKITDIDVSNFRLADTKQLSQFSNLILSMPYLKRIHGLDLMTIQGDKISPNSMTRVASWINRESDYNFKSLDEVKAFISALDVNVRSRALMLITINKLVLTAAQKANLESSGPAY